MAFDFGSYDAVVFDLGGVILPLTFPALRSSMAQLMHCSPSDIRLDSVREVHEQFERGEVTARVFRDALCAAFFRGPDGKRPSDSLIDASWNAILGEIPEAHVDFLHNLRRTKRVFVLSNTNEIHVQSFEAKYASQFAGAQFRQLFDRAYYSQELHLRKPETAIFQAVLAREHLDPARTLFVDDHEENVRAATGVGMQTMLYPHNASMQLYFQ